MIKHIWFDFSETIANIIRQRHDELKYSEYASATDRPVTDELKAEFDRLYEQHNHSISDIFFSLGQPAGWWSSRIALVPPEELFVLADQNIPEVLSKLEQIVPVSIFSNIELTTVLPALGLDPKQFNHIISSGMVSKPKPALDGFYMIVELSNLSADQILYIGDHVQKDIIPAKKVGLQTGIMWVRADEADYSFSSFSEILELVGGKL